MWEELAPRVILGSRENAVLLYTASFIHPHTHRFRSHCAKCHVTYTCWGHVRSEPRPHGVPPSGGPVTMSKLSLERKSLLMKPM